MASHFGKAAVFLDRPATAGNAEEMTNSTAAVMARGRSQGRCGPDTWRAALEFVGRLICSADIGQIQLLCAQDQNQSGKIREVRQALILPFLSAGAPSLRVGLCKGGEVDVYFCCPPCFHSSERVPLITGAGQSLTRDLCRHRVSADLQAIVSERCLYHRLTRLRKLPGMCPKFPFWSEFTRSEAEGPLITRYSI